jgi:ribosomal-protein-alanine N-acetyltransferase
VQQPKFNPFPTLSSNRLDLRELKMSDKNEIFRLRSDEIVLKYIAIPKAKNLKDAEGFITMLDEGMAENKWVTWAMSLKNSDTVIGTICLWHLDILTESAELGYGLLPEFYNQGLMTEATEVVLNFGFKNLGFREIDAITHQKNIACSTVLKKFGFMQDADFECDDVDLVRYFLKLQ